jgi:hypothetical protein
MGMKSFICRKAVTKEFLAGRVGRANHARTESAVKSPNPIFPPSCPTQRLFKEPLAESKFLAVKKKWYLPAAIFIQFSIRPETPSMRIDPAKSISSDKTQ